MTKTTQWKHPLFKPSSSSSAISSNSRTRAQHRDTSPLYNRRNNVESNQNLNQTLPGRPSHSNSNSNINTNTNATSNSNSNQVENGLNFTAPVRPSSSSGEQSNTRRSSKPAWKK